ncbi:MAG: IS200/IS605 family transposase [Anaerolineales bacterium]|nr:IS200/IS605 family transposase [Anaerolineales bacterium]
MPYWRLFYHIVWSTKDRQPRIDPAWEADLHGYIRGKATALECPLLAIGGMSDHFHIVISIPPSQPIATIVGRLKGASSHYANDHFVPGKDFAWQSEYGVLSVSESRLSKVVAYVLNQKKHHAEDNVFDVLENFGVSLTPDGLPSG